MGMFDSVWVPCPKCGNENEFQSKGGACLQKGYELDAAPSDVLSDVNRHSPITCCYCGAAYRVDVVMTATACPKLIDVGENGESEKSRSTIQMRKTERGFAIGEFKDHYQESCSIQESSIASPPCIWLGVDETRGTPSRMHLTQKQVKDLIPLLEHFVQTGELSREED